LVTCIISECPKACDYRCSKASGREDCLYFCNLCCDKCLCVPSGTFGNKEECPCYNNWKAKSGKPKCPWFSFNFFFLSTL